MTGKVKIGLDNIQETLLLPLWGRAVETRKFKPKLSDPKAIEVIDHIVYDFSIITKNIGWITQLAWVARSLHIDRTISGFIKDHPDATIVNIGAGLDTTFERVDNGRIRFYDLDLPDVIEIRRKFFIESDRRKSITCSFLDPGWFSHFNMDEEAILRWAIRSAKKIESWDPRFILVKEYPMFRGFKKGYPFKMQYGMWMSDRLNIMSMVHLKIG
jgi:O-methyltransferase involved in polyketide biosynthesis